MGQGLDDVRYRAESNRLSSTGDAAGMNSIRSSLIDRRSYNASGLDTQPGLRSG